MVNLNKLSFKKEILNKKINLNKKLDELLIKRIFFSSTMQCCYTLNFQLIMPKAIYGTNFKK